MHKKHVRKSIYVSPLNVIFIQLYYYYYFNNQTDIGKFLNPGMEHKESRNLIFKNLLGNCNFSLQQLSEIKNL